MEYRVLLELAPKAAYGETAWINEGKIMDWTGVEMELCATGKEQLAQWVRNEVQQMHGVLLWALYHNQGHHSQVGQTIRRALGIDAHARLTEKQVTLAKQAARPVPINAI